jgi:hypothetical protein
MGSLRPSRLGRLPCPHTPLTRFGEGTHLLIKSGWSWRGAFTR